MIASLHLLTQKSRFTCLVDTREAVHREKAVDSGRERMPLICRSFIRCSVGVRLQHAAPDMAAKTAGTAYRGGTSVGTQRPCDDL